jgi:hypothetical protein
MRLVVLFLNKFKVPAKIVKLLIFSLYCIDNNEDEEDKEITRKKNTNKRKVCLDSDDDEDENYSMASDISNYSYNQKSNQN